MPNKRHRRPTEQPEESEALDVIKLLDRTWEGFVTFTQHTAKHPPARIKDTEFPQQMQQILNEYPDVLKATFAAGFLGCLEALRVSVMEQVETLNLEHMAEHHQRDPRIPRA